MKDEDVNRLTVEIFGQHYTIMGKASLNHMRMVAGYVDDKMRDIHEANPKLDSVKLAVLSGVNIADEYFRMKKEYDEIVQVLKENGLLDAANENEDGSENADDDRER